MGIGREGSLLKLWFRFVKFKFIFLNKKVSYDLVHKNVLGKVASKTNFFNVETTYVIAILLLEKSFSVLAFKN